jgi:cytochrome c oxidase assembly factor CtaG
LQLAHGTSPVDPSMWWLRWAFEPLIWCTLIAAAAFYVAAARRVNGWPRTRSLYFLSGTTVAGVALTGPPAVFDTSLFWVHMVQHVLMVMVAAPLIVLGAPVALALRASNHATRARLRRALHSRFVRAAGHPLVAWSLFALVIAISHVSGFYDAALENEFVHILEHAAYMGAALLFWSPVAGLDPGARRIGWPVRVVYVLLTMPVQAFLGLVLYSSDRPLYHHYATVERAWGPAPIEDQRLAGVVMWVGGEFLTLIALVVVVLAWMRYDERLAVREDRRLGLAR